jgi:hypothetical protein
VTFEQQTLVDDEPPVSPSSSLVQHAIDALRKAAAIFVEEHAVFQEERNVWLPNSWLMSRCRQALAEVGAGEAALDVAQLFSDRDKLAVPQTLHQLAEQAGDRPQAVRVIEQTLAERDAILLSEHRPLDSSREDSTRKDEEEYLLASATRAALGDGAAVFNYLERLDQRQGAWDRIMLEPEQRALLARSLAAGGRHPLTTSMVAASVPRYGESGALLLQGITSALDPDNSHDRLLIERCAGTMRYASLTTMQGHRVAVAVMARAGWAEEVVGHLTTIANIQEARRESGLSLRRNDQQLLRQVKRTQANADIDFQVYTLQEAIRGMPVRRITREERAELARALAVLGMKSDGWTASGAAATLVELGAIKLAINVVDHIAPTDPTRSEGAIALVKGLLEIGEVSLAAEQTEKALAWIPTIESENAERATIWGLAELYLQHNRPQEALDLLSRRVEETGFLKRVRDLFQPSVTDDQLRDNRLRLHAYLQQNRSTETIQPILSELQKWGPILLDGDVLIAFYVDGLLGPLLKAGYLTDAWALFPDLLSALKTSMGDRYADHLRRFSMLFAAEAPVLDAVGRETLMQFLVDVWSADVARGIWQTVHGIEGTLPLILALSGPQALAEIALMAKDEGDSWLPPS